jgi:hypothetical protein
MRGALAGLAVLLAVQLAAAALLLVGEERDGGSRTVVPLVSAEADGVDRVVITDGTSSANLVRQDGAWRLPELGPVPVNEAGLTDALATLREIRTDWPVASTRSSHQRFDVAEEKFQRRVQLFSGETLLADFYLGSSPGFRQVHLRRAGEDEVYVVRLSNHDLPAGDADWLDKSLLAMSDPVRVEGPDYVIVRSGENGWAFEQAAGTGESAATAGLDADRARRLANALANLRVVSIADGTRRAGDAAAEDRYSLTVHSADRRRHYDFFTVDGDYYVRRDDLDAVFTVSQYDYDRIVEVTRAELTSPAQDDEPGEAVVPEAPAG